MSFPPPTAPSAGGPTPAATTPAGWYDDPWDPRARRWWDGAAWSGYTDAHFAGAAAVDAAAAGWAQRNAGPTRLLAALLPLAPVGQVASLATSSSGMRDLFRQVREGGGASLARGGELTGAMAVGQVVSLLTVVALVLRMVWLHRATRVARALGGHTRRSPGWACVGWLLPLLNFWWPYQALRDLTAGVPGHARALTWWWVTYLLGTIGGAFALMVSWSVTVPAAVAVMALPAASLLVSALLERRLVLAVHADHGRRAGLTSP